MYKRQVLNEYGINGIEDAKAICDAKGIDPYTMCKETQPICFENACWAYVVGAAIAIKKGCTNAAEAAEAAAAKKAAEMAKWGPNPIPADQLDGNAYTDDIYLTSKGITFFNIGQTELSPKEKLRLDIIATQIKNAPKNKIYVIEGHADPQTGSKAVNTRLAEQRAKKVYDYLISKGVKAENLQYKGYSDTKSPFKTEQENRVTVIR